jgi:tetratricopeptide (TPR) repeat protein
MQQDYILRMIQQLGVFVRRVTGLREEGKTDEALHATGEAFGSMGGLNASLVHALSEDDLIHLLRARGAIDSDRCLALAEILREEASIYDDLGQPEQSLPRYLKALRLHLEAFPDPEDSPGPISTDAIEALVERIPASSLSFQTFDRLISFLTESGKYAMAENVLLERHEALPEEEDLIGIGEEFYKSVLDQPDDGIEAGGLTREEAEEVLASLLEDEKSDSH